MIKGSMERRCGRQTVALAVLLLCLWIPIPPGGAHAQAATSASPPASASTSPTSLPPALQALEQKMEQLQINSERYSRTIRSTGTITTERRSRHGKRVSRRKHVSLSVTERGEASLSPDEGQVFIAGHTRRPSLLAIGSSLYSYSAKVARTDGGRPWIRLDSSGAVSVATVFPYHGEAREVSFGGSGSYAGLINLLATAVGQVEVVGPATIEGQQTTEFTATVEPLSLIKGLSKKTLALIRGHFPSEQLAVFITEAGVPLRVSSSMRLDSSAISETTDILAVNIPVKVTRPPARRTISFAKYIKLISRKHKRGGGVVIETRGSIGTRASLTIPPPPSTVRLVGQLSNPRGAPEGGTSACAGRFAGSRARIGLDRGAGSCVLDGPVERVVGDLLPALLADGEVRAVGELLVVGERARLPLKAL